MQVKTIVKSSKSAVKIPQWDQYNQKRPSYRISYVTDVKVMHSSGRKRPCPDFKNLQVPDNDKLIIST